MIFRKNGVQALVEFDSVETAERAREALNGADIYSGCCTLKIDYAKPLKLGVVKNDTDSWDYVNPHLGKEGPQKSTPLLPDPKFSDNQPGNGSAARYGPPGYDEPGMPPRRMGPPGGPMDRRPGYDYRGGAGYEDEYGRPEGGYDGFNRRGGPPLPQADSRYPPAPGHSQDPYHDPYGPAPPRGGSMPPQGRGAMGRGGPEPLMGPGYRGGGRGGGPGRGRGGPPPQGGYEAGVGGGSNGNMLNQGCVLMVYGCVGEKVNCQKLFNLFCLYGNVVRIRFLKSKEGAAMVQMGDLAACDRAMMNLANCPLYGKKLTLGFSKQAFIQDIANPGELSDGTPSFVDYMGTRNNRFATPEAASKNKILPPGKALYFYNVPAKISEDEVKKVFRDADAKTPVRIRIFPSKNEKSCTGIAEWDSKADCVESLVAANHTTLPNPGGKNPFILKLSFTGQQGRE